MRRLIIESKHKSEKDYELLMKYLEDNDWSFKTPKVNRCDSCNKIYHNPSNRHFGSLNICGDCKKKFPELTRTINKSNYYKYGGVITSYEVVGDKIVVEGNNKFKRFSFAVNTSDYFLYKKINGYYELKIKTNAISKKM